MKKKSNKKNKNFYFILCVFVISNSLFAANIDSLKIELRKAKADTNKVKIYETLAKEIIYNEPDKAIEYGKEALLLSEKLDYKIGIGTALKIIAFAYDNQGEYSKSLDYYNRSLNIFKTIKTKEGLLKMTECLSNIANIHYAQGEYDIAIKGFLEALDLYNKLGDKHGAAIVLDNMGNIYYRTKNYPKAISKYLEGLKLFTEIKNALGKADCLAGIALVYSDQEKFPESLENYTEALKIFKEIDNQFYICETLINIGVLKEKTGNYQEALQYYNEVLKIVGSSQDDSHVAVVLTNIGSVYLKQANATKAIDLFNKALIIAKKINFKELVSNIYLNLSDSYSELNNFKKSLDFYKLFTAYKDSVFNEENSKQINELSAKYESEKKEKEIVLLNADVLAKQKDKELLSAQIQKRNSVIYGTVSGALLLIISIVLLFNRRQLKQKNKHQSEIFKQQEDTAISILEGQEKERARIAKDLHDSVGTFLSTLKINLELFEGAIAKEKIGSYKSALELIDKISVELRNIMNNLSDETLQEFGLVNAFEDLIERINRLGGTRFDFHSQGLSVRPSTIIEINLYRVGQELLSNCVKYANASNATLQLMAREDKILLMLEDDGTGFDTKNPKPNNNDHGMGLKNVRDRISFIKGTVQIESGSVNGTTIIIETPQTLN
jgi:signal transduction histidine kinase